MLPLLCIALCHVLPSIPRRRLLAFVRPHEICQFLGKKDCAILKRAWPLPSFRNCLENFLCCFKRNAREEMGFSGAPTVRATRCFFGLPLISISNPFSCICSRHYSFKFISSISYYVLNASHVGCGWNSYILNSCIHAFMIQSCIFGIKCVTSFVLVSVK